MVAHCNYSYTLEQEAKIDQFNSLYHGINLQKDTSL